jgi:hypothetical protein
LRYGVTVDLF